VLKKLRRLEMAKFYFTASDGIDNVIDLEDKTEFILEVLDYVLPNEDLVNKTWDFLKELPVFKHNKIVARYLHGYLLEMPNQRLLVAVHNRKTKSIGMPESVGQKLYRVVITYSKREWIALDEGESPLLLNNRPITLLKTLKDQMELHVGEIKGIFVSIHPVTLNIDSKEIKEKMRCSYCMDPFLEGDQVIVCPSCRTVHHQDCWEANGNRCAGPTGCKYGMRISTGEKQKIVVD
jgi:hypothetical protein